MSRTVKGKPGIGAFYDARRPFSFFAGPGRGSAKVKRMTRRTERAQAKETLRAALLPLLPTPQPRRQNREPLRSSVEGVGDSTARGAG